MKAKTKEIKTQGKKETKNTNKPKDLQRRNAEKENGSEDKE